MRRKIFRLSIASMAALAMFIPSAAWGDSIGTELSSEPDAPTAQYIDAATSGDVNQTDATAQNGTTQDVASHVMPAQRKAAGLQNDYSAYTNLALNASATMNVPSGTDWYSYPSSAVDGNAETYAQAADGRPFTLTLDLGRQVSFDTLTIRGVDKQLYSYRIGISDNGTDWTTIIERETTEDQRKAFFTWDELDSPKSARYVKVDILDGEEWIGISEFSMYYTRKLRPVRADVAAGMVMAGTEVMLSSDDSDAIIHYTTDGTVPNADSPQYKKPIVIDRDMTINAVAMQSGKENSDLLTLEYRVLDVDIQPDTTYYVDSTAGEPGDGSKQRPFNSLEAVNAANFLPGDKVLFKAGTEYHGTLIIGDGTQAQAQDGSGASKAGLDSGEPDNPVVFSAYGKGDMPKIIADTDHIKGREAVLISDAHDVTVKGLEIINKDADESDYQQYIRRGIAVMNHNNGKLANITIADNYIHDVTGQMDEGGIQGGAAGIITEVYSFTKLVVTNGEWARDSSANPTDDMKKPSWFDNMRITGNRIENVSRSGINAASDYKCREAVDWNYGSGCNALQRDNAPWVPSTNTLVENNQLDHIGGDGIVVQETKGAVVQRNRVYDAANSPSKGSNAGVWVWNADDTLFQYNEVGYTNKRADNNDGTAWDFDYGSRNTIYQYNYSHDNAGGALLTCACAGRMSQAVGSVFRYNLSVNDGVNAKGCDGNVNTNRVMFLAGIKDMSFYNNTIVAPDVEGEYEVIDPSGSANSAFFANNLFVLPGSVAAESVNVPDNYDATLRWGNNLFVADGERPSDDEWPILSAQNNQYVTLSEYVAATGVDLAAVRSGDLATLRVGSRWTDKAGRAMAPEGTKDYDGNAVPTWSAPDIGAFQTNKFADDSGKVGALQAGKSTIVDVPGNAVIAVTAIPDKRATLNVAIDNNRGFTQTITRDSRATYVRTASDSSRLVLECAGVGQCADIEMKTTSDALWDGSFESANWGTSSLSPWTYGTAGNVQNYDTGYRVNDELRSGVDEADKLASSGSLAAKLGIKSEGDSVTDETVQLNQRALLAEPGKTYALSFWATVGENNDGTHTISAEVRYRRSKDGWIAEHGGVFSHYIDVIKDASVTCSADRRADYRVYCTSTFTVPEDADPSGALWLAIAQPDLKNEVGVATYVDSVAMAKTVPVPQLPDTSTEPDEPGEEENGPDASGNETGDGSGGGKHTAGTLENTGSAVLLVAMLAVVCAFAGLAGLGLRRK